MRAAVTALALLVVGCDPSAYRIHASAVVTVAAAHTVAGGAYDAARDAALDQVEAQHPEVGEARTAALRAEAARWTPAAAALDAVRSALLTWLDAVDLARAAEDDRLLELLLPMAARVLALYDDAARALRELGVDAPALPDAVRSLIGGAQ